MQIRVLRSLSLLMTVAGILTVLLVPIIDLNPTWALVGLLLAVAGGVKLVVVHLWRHLVAGPGLDDRRARAVDAD